METAKSPGTLNEWTLSHCSWETDRVGFLWVSATIFHQRISTYASFMHGPCSQTPHLINATDFIHMELVAGTITHAWRKIINTHIFSRRHSTAFSGLGDWTALLHLWVILNGDIIRKKHQQAKKQKTKKQTSALNGLWKNLSWQYACQTAKHFSPLSMCLWMTVKAPELLISINNSYWESTSNEDRLYSFQPWVTVTEWVPLFPETL